MTPSPFTFSIPHGGLSGKDTGRETPLRPPDIPCPAGQKGPALPQRGSCRRRRLRGDSLKRFRRLAASTEERPPPGRPPTGAAAQPRGDFRWGRVGGSTAAAL